jgi:hypothetical protein
VAMGGVLDCDRRVVVNDERLIDVLERWAGADEQNPVYEFVTQGYDASDGDKRGGEMDQGLGPFDPA